MLFRSRMYEYIKLKVRKDDTIVPIEFAEYKDATGVTSYSTFTSDRAELVRAGIIAPTMHAIWFWTNPVFFFKGHRIKTLAEHSDVVAMRDLNKLTEK